MKENLSLSEVHNYWAKFKKQEELSEQQLVQFMRYAALIQEWNEKINLTTLVDYKSIISGHFQDSLIIDKHINLSTIKGLADIGSGAGLPGIPLKIKHPHIFVVLIEVTQKRIEFLRTVINELQLENIEINDTDWRTFLRKTTYSLDLFVARASLVPEELVRMFKPSCHYKTAKLIYWASEQWFPDKKEKSFLENEIIYSIGNKKRRLVLFSLLNRL